MKTMKVKLTIQRDSAIKSIIEKVVEVEKQETDTKTRRLAELNYCNDYINRDGRIKVFENLTDAKKFACLKIKSKLL